MKVGYFQKEEILMMLTEINEEIEDLEKTLQKNLLSLRTDYLKKQGEKISDCEYDLSKIEKKVKEQNQTKIEGYSNSLTCQRGMKLELGY